MSLLISNLELINFLLKIEKNMSEITMSIMEYSDS